MDTPPFDKNDRDAIELALQDPNPANPIAVAVADAIEQFAARIAQQADREGRFPKQLMLLKPATVFDEMVIRLTLQTMADQSGQPIDIVWVPR